MTFPTNIIHSSLSDDNIDATPTTSANSYSFFNNAPLTFPSPFSITNNGTTSSSTTTVTNGSIQTNNPYIFSTPTATTPSPSTATTNGISSSAPPIINARTTAAVWEELITQMDKFIQAAAIAAYKKSGVNIGVISCKYSINIHQNNVKDYIWTNRECTTPPTRYIASLRNNDRIVLSDFNVADKQVGYYDSLKVELTKESCGEFFVVKYSVEKYLDSMHFDTAEQERINSTINDIGFPSFAHICRIAEEICFNGRNCKLNPFNIRDEADRIKRLLQMISVEGWNGEWLPTIQESRVESIVQEAVLGGGGIATTTSNPRITVVNGQNVSLSVNGGGGAGQRRSRDGRIVEAVNKMFNVSLKGS